MAKIRQRASRQGGLAIHQTCDLDYRLALVAGLAKSAAPTDTWTCIRSASRRRHPHPYPAHLDPAGCAEHNHDPSQLDAVLFHHLLRRPFLDDNDNANDNADDEEEDGDDTTNKPARTDLENEATVLVAALSLSLRAGAPIHVGIKRQNEMKGIRLLVVIHDHFILQPGNVVSPEVARALLVAYTEFVCTRHLTLRHLPLYGPDQMGICIDMELVIDAKHHHHHHTEETPWIRIISIRLAGSEPPPQLERLDLEAWRDVWCEANQLSDTSLGDVRERDRAMSLYLGPGRFVNHGCHAPTVLSTVSRGQDCQTLEIRLDRRAFFKSQATATRDKTSARSYRLVPGDEFLWNYKKTYYSASEWLVGPSRSQLMASGTGSG